MTKKFAEELARIEKANLFEIQPETPYTTADLDWKDQQARSTLEMKDLNCRPVEAVSLMRQNGFRNLLDQR